MHINFLKVTLRRCRLLFEISKEMGNKSRFLQNGCGFFDHTWEASKFPQSCKYSGDCWSCSPFSLTKSMGQFNIFCQKKRILHLCKICVDQCMAAGSSQPPLGHVRVLVELGDKALRCSEDAVFYVI